MTTKVDIGAGDITVRELLERAGPGDELVLERDGKVVARVTCEKPKRQPPVFGQLAGKIWMSDDFDEPLSREDLADWEDSPGRSRMSESDAADPDVRPLRFGLWIGLGWISDDFDAPLPPEEQALWDGDCSGPD